MQKYNFIHVIFLFMLFPYWFLSSCDSDSDKSIFDLNDRINGPELQLQQQQQQQQQQDNVLLFGFDLRSSPQEDARQYLPFLKYLESSTGYQFKLHFMAKNNNIIDALGNNQVQFAAIGATSFIVAEHRYGVIPLVRGINHQGKADYRSIFVIRPDSKLKDITDIKDKHLAFGSKTSTQGHLIPRIILAEHNIGLDTLASYAYTGSHQNCANAVVSGKFDICAMQDTMAITMSEQGLVRILSSSDYYPSSGIATNKNVPAEVIAKVKKALLDFQPQSKDKLNLYNWDKTEMPKGFVEAKNEDYAKLRKWAIRLGFIKLDKPRESKP